MALNNDEQAQRRQRREQLRQQRLAQQRKLRLRLIAAGIVLAACGVLIYLVSRGGSRQEPQALTAVSQNTAPASNAAPLSASSQEAEEPTTVIHFAAAGDLNVCDEVVNAGGVTYDYSRAFLDVLPLLAEADLTTVNFEGNVAGSPYGTVTGSAPPELLTALADAGVDLLQVANSQSINNGMIGLSSTLQAIRSAGLEPVGAYATNKEFRESGGYTIREVKGIRIAIVAFTKGMEGMALPEGSENCINLLYSDYATTYQQVDKDRITKILRAAAEEEPDITIALLHWGSKYNDKISDSQETIKNLMLSEGVDVIIGTHPHYVQAIEFNQEKGTFLCYSLGDFFGSAAQPGTDYSIILDLEITKDNETGVTKVTDYSYTPIYTEASADGYRVVRIQQAMTGYDSNYVDKVSADTYDSMTYALERIADRVSPTKSADDGN